MSEKSVTIPALPCDDFDATLEFWQILGFEVTYKQKAPNSYAVVHHNDYDIHFFGLKPLRPADNFSTCLIVVSEIEQLHQNFAGHLRAHLGKVPLQGFPRLSRMREGQTRFTVTDNAGNSVIFIKRGGQDEQAAQAYKQPGQASLQRAIQAAARLRDFKGDDLAAAKVLDTALKRSGQQKSVDFTRALEARIELAVALDDTQTAQRLESQLADMNLPDAENS